MALIEAFASFIFPNRAKALPAAVTFKNSLRVNMMYQFSIINKQSYPSFSYCKYRISYDDSAHITIIGKFYSQRLICLDIVTSDRDPLS